MRLEALRDNTRPTLSYITPHATQYFKVRNCNNYISLRRQLSKCTWLPGWMAAAQLSLLRSHMHAWRPPKLHRLRSPRQTDWNVPFVVRRQHGGDAWWRKGEGRGTCWITAVQLGKEWMRDKNGPQRRIPFRQIHSVGRKIADVTFCWTRQYKVNSPKFKSPIQAWRVVALTADKNILISLLSLLKKSK